MPMHPRHLLSILKDAASDWVDDGAMRLSSSLAYYAIFSLAPLPVIVISMTASFRFRSSWPSAFSCSFRWSSASSLPRWAST